MKIKQCHIENFTVFGKQDIEFCDGVNVIIGANGAGKSHLLKLLYAMTRWFTAEENGLAREQNELRFLNLLNGVFKPENGELAQLMRNRASQATMDAAISLGTRNCSIRIYADKKYQDYDPSLIASLPDATGLFIPPNDVLAIYPGFAASYEKRELAFDQTYYDLCKALAAAPLKQKNVALSRLLLNLEDVIHGKVVQQGDRFYVQDRETRKSLEAHLLAEGHRKIAAIVHLINNGSLDTNTILFWDEPEANLNPRLIKHIALFLRELARVGVQVFIATHDYLLTGELSLAAEYKTAPEVPIRFFAMSRTDDKPVKIQSGDTLADLQDNPILDEFAEHYQREQEAAIQFIKKRESA
jgi:ABC-type ATPase involved in cell division